MDAVDDGGGDDVTVETVDESDLPGAGSGSSGPTQNSNPDWLFSGFYSVVDIIQSNGWILLILLIGLWFAKQKLEEYLREKRRRDGEAAHAKDPDQLLDLQFRREERIRRLQEQQDAAAALAAEKQREKEEKERKEKIQEYDDFLSGKGYKPKSRHANATTTDSADLSPQPQLPNRPRQRLRDDDYNPMMGSGGSGGYRPAPRGGGAGGG